MKTLPLLLLLAAAAYAEAPSAGSPVPVLSSGEFSPEAASTTSADSVILRNLWFTDELLPEARNFTHRNMVPVKKMNTAALLAYFDYSADDAAAPVFSKKEEVFAQENDPSSFGINGSDRRLLYTVYSAQMKARLPSDGARSGAMTARELRFEYYRADTEGLHPLVLVLPPIMGSTIVDRDVAAILAGKGMDVIIPEMEELFRPNISVEEMNTIGVQAIVSLRMITSAVLADPAKRIDRERVCVFGVSLGAVIGASLTGIDRRITHAYLIVGGGNFADIATTSLQDRVATFRNYNFSSDPRYATLPLLKKLGLWFHETREKFVSDPVFFADAAAAKKIYMVMSTNDDMIPFRDQLELWNAFGHPRYELSRLSHIGTVVRWYINYRYDAFKFFSAK